MKVIPPTPSQAAVVLRKFLQQNGLDVQLAVAQEASARMRGYADWQALVSDLEPRTGQSREKAAERQLAPVPPRLTTREKALRLGILLLRGEVIFDDIAAGHLVLRHEIALRALVRGSRPAVSQLALLTDTALSYLRKDGSHCNVLVRDLYDAEPVDDIRWRLTNGATFQVRQASVESGTNAQGIYLAPVTVHFSTGSHCAGLAKYSPRSGRVVLDEEVLNEMSQYVNRIVMSVSVEIAGKQQVAEIDKDGEFIVPFDGFNDELAFGTHLKEVRVPAPAFVRFNNESRTSVITWNEVLLFGVSRVDHRPDSRLTGSFGGGNSVYVGDGKWQQDASEAFYLYDAAGNLWTPRKRELR